MLLEVNDRTPGILAPLPVDLLDEAIDFVIKEPVLGHVGATGNADLHKDEAFAEGRVAL